MLFTAFTIIGFVFIAVIALVIGHFASYQEIYFLGVVLLLVTGLLVVDNGIAEKSGEIISFNETVTGNVTSQDRVVTFVFDTNQNIFTNAFGLLFILIAAGLSLTWRSRKRLEKQAEERSLDFSKEE